MRILFVARPHSVHTARWISQLVDQRWDLHLFPTHEWECHPELRGVTIHRLLTQLPQDVHTELRQTGIAWPLRRGAGRLAAHIDNGRFRRLRRAQRLARLIGTLRPDIIHSLEMQHAGYLTLAARTECKAGGFPPWIYSCWGNDLFRFGSQAEHTSRIRAVLSTCDYLITDCRRDLKLAEEYGFRGEALGVFPVGGGYPIKALQQWRAPGPVSARGLLVVKGYQSELHGGRALVALDALEMCADVLGNIDIAIYSAEEPVVAAARRLEQTLGRIITIVPLVPHNEILRLMGRARVALALSLSDGTPHAMLEAMLMGAFPIQSDTQSTAEWIQDGKNGFLVLPEDAEAVAASLRRVLTDDALVDRAAAYSAALCQRQIDDAIVRPRVVEAYKHAARAESFGALA